MSLPFIKNEQIPSTLWKRTGPAVNQSQSMMSLPPILAEAYGELLKELGLWTAAENQQPNDEGPQGGKTVEATNEHFARNFSGSSARMQLVALDPNEVFGTTRDALVRLFAGGDLSLLDIPCGAGAAGATLLCLIAELRKQKVLPRYPLKVTILGGDISEPARNLKRKLFQRIKPRLIEYGIQVNLKIRNWDVENEDQTTELVDSWIRQRRSRSRAAVLAVNFSGFLHKKVKQCAGQLREMLRYARVHDATVFWVEPQTNAALKNLFPDLFKHVLHKVAKLRLSWPNPETPRKTECGVAHPVQQGGKFTARAAALHLEVA